MANCIKRPTYPGEYESMHYVTCAAIDCDCPLCDRFEVEKVITP